VPGTADVQRNEMNRPVTWYKRLRLGFLIAILLGLVAAILAFKVNLFSVNVLEPIFSVILKRY